jgi:hypothetical protein
MIDNEDSVQPPEDCLSVYEAPKTAIQGKNVDDLDRSVRIALEDSERCVGWSRSCPLPHRETPGLRAKSSGVSGKGRTYPTSNMIRAELKGTSWRSKRYSPLSTHRAHPLMKTSTRANVPPIQRPFTPTVLQLLYPRVVRPKLRPH